MSMSLSNAYVSESLCCPRISAADRDQLTQWRRIYQPRKLSRGGAIR
jgi:hypothetical protein